MQVIDGGAAAAVMDGDGDVAATSDAREGRAQRLARARALLGTAERSVGLRGRLTVLPGGADGQEGAGAGVPAAPMADVGDAAGGTAGLTASAAGAQALGDVLAVPDALRPLLPGGLPRGSVVQVTGSTSLLLAMAGAACAGGAWCAMTAVPDVGWQAAAAAGLPLDRVAVVPAPGPDAPLVLAALADGFDVLVAGDARGLTARDQRSLTARLRTRGAVLLTTVAWPEAHLTLEAHAQGFAGLGAGDGYLRGVDWTVTASGRLALRQGTAGESVDVRLGSTGMRPALGTVSAVAGTRDREAVGVNRARTGTDGGGLDTGALLDALAARRGAPAARAVV